MPSKLEDLTDQAEQMLSELDRSEEEVETIIGDLRNLEEEYDENVGGTNRPELIAVSDALADLTDGTRRFNDTISNAKGGLRTWLDAHGVGTALSNETQGVLSGSADPKKKDQKGARQDLEEISEWLPDINPGYNADPFDPRSVNCGKCAEAVFLRLSGKDSIAISANGTYSIPEMEARTGLKQREMAPSEIAATLLSRGKGSHCVVGIDRLFTAGHWFNAYCDGNTVYAIDGQTGEILDWPPDMGSETTPVVRWDASL